MNIIEEYTPKDRIIDFPTYIFKAYKEYFHCTFPAKQEILIISAAFAAS